mmetsp:Transcript_8337/g.23308  ORF Transcript_8337/g.23308 Transcript_8337/m.23308 type:complete len:311 (-) Transcript_8337:1995-2927(-)
MESMPDSARLVEVFWSNSNRALPMTSVALARVPVFSETILHPSSSSSSADLAAAATISWGSCSSASFLASASEETEFVIAEMLSSASISSNGGAEGFSGGHFSVVLESSSLTIASITPAQASRVAPKCSAAAPKPSASLEKLLLADSGVATSISSSLSLVGVLGASLDSEEGDVPKTMSKLCRLVLVYFVGRSGRIISASLAAIRSSSRRSSSSLWLSASASSASKRSCSNLSSSSLSCSAASASASNAAASSLRSFSKRTPASCSGFIVLLGSSQAQQVSVSVTSLTVRQVEHFHWPGLGAKVSPHDPE